MKRNSFECSPDVSRQRSKARGLMSLALALSATGSATGCMGVSDAMMVAWPNVSPAAGGVAQEEAPSGEAMGLSARHSETIRSYAGKAGRGDRDSARLAARHNFNQARQEQIFAERRARWDGMRGQLKHRRLWMLSDWKN